MACPSSPSHTDALCNACSQGSNRPLSASATEPLLTSPASSKRRSACKSVCCTPSEAACAGAGQPFWLSAQSGWHLPGFQLQLPERTNRGLTPKHFFWLRLCWALQRGCGVYYLRLFFPALKVREINRSIRYRHSHSFGSKQCHP